MPAEPPHLVVGPPGADPIYRVGYGPDPWSWVPWEFGPFTGRWDDPEETYRVIYGGTTALACFVEVLARFRRDPALIAEMQALEEDERDDLYPTVEPGVVPRSWIQPRLLGSATLGGTYADVQHPASIAYLRPTFVALAMELSFPDFDGAAIRSSEPRLLTQKISRYLYFHDLPPVDGVAFESRHGNDLELLAIFEKLGADGLAGDRCPLLTPADPDAVDPASVALQEALTLHDLELE